MEIDGDYSEEISSSSVNHIRTLDLLSPTKKRKFQAEAKELNSLQASKYICSEKFVERGLLSSQSLQAKLFYTQTKKGKAPSVDIDDPLYNQEESTQDSNSTIGDSFSQCSDTKSNVYAKASLYDESSSSSSHSGGAISGDVFCSMNSGTMVDGSGFGDDEFEGEDGVCEDNVDEFGHCLGYLASACEGDNSKNGQQDLEDLLYSSGMIERSCLLSSESLTTEVAQLNMGKATIDQEFEQYFSMLML